jgi:hypothetical protein
MNAGVVPGCTRQGSAMNLANILSRKSSMKRAFVSLESDMDDMLNEEFMLPPEAEAAIANGEQAEQLPAEAEDLPELAAMPEEQPASEPAEDRPADRMTAHAQNRITDIAAFDDARNVMQQQFDTINSALTKIAMPTCGAPMSSNTRLRPCPPRTASSPTGWTSWRSCAAATISSSRC